MFKDAYRTCLMSLKRILGIVGFCIISTSISFAQEISYWVGQSSNPDPIMSFHESFMDAFSKYVQSDGASLKDNTCRIEILFGSLNGDEHEVVIAVGRGALIRYAILTQEHTATDGMIKETILNIYFEEQSATATQGSEHKYRKTEGVLIKDGKAISKKTDFSYESISTQVQ